MKFYYAIVHKDADSSYGISFPDLPGCFAAAESIEEVLPTAMDVLAFWLEDNPKPAPSDLFSIRINAASDLAAGAFLIGVPALPST